MKMRRGVRYPRNPRVRRVLTRLLVREGRSKNYVDALLRGRLRGIFDESKSDADEIHQMLRNPEYRKNRMKWWLAYLKNLGWVDAPIVKEEIERL